MPDKPKRRSFYDRLLHPSKPSDRMSNRNMQKQYEQLDQPVAPPKKERKRRPKPDRG